MDPTVRLDEQEEGEEDRLGDLHGLLALLDTPCAAPIDDGLHRLLGAVAAHRVTLGPRGWRH